MTSLVNYHKSIGAEIISLKNRVRDLLEESVHWGEDGRSKEAILKLVLERHLPKSIKPCTGFVKLGESCTSQQDIILLKTTHPTLFQTDDFTITTPSTVNGIIEVKTKINSLEILKSVLTKIADNVESIRTASNSGRLTFTATNPWASLFVYEKMASSIEPIDILQAINTTSMKKLSRVIQAVSLGPDVFIRYWPERGAWDYYLLPDLSFSYFISNQIWQDETNSIDSSPFFALRDGKGSSTIATLNHDFVR